MKNIKASRRPKIVKSPNIIIASIIKKQPAASSTTDSRSTSVTKGKFKTPKQDAPEQPSSGASSTGKTPCKGAKVPSQKARANW